jgi:hypothetical protein
MKFHGIPKLPQNWMQKGCTIAQNLIKTMGSGGSDIHPSISYPNLAAPRFG